LLSFCFGCFEDLSPEALLLAPQLLQSPRDDAHGGVINESIVLGDGLFAILVLSFVGLSQYSCILIEFKRRDRDEVVTPFAEQISDIFIRPWRQRELDPAYRESS
jgi:hypothetical protein